MILVETVWAELIPLEARGMNGQGGFLWLHLFRVGETTVRKEYKRYEDKRDRWEAYGEGTTEGGLGRNGPRWVWTLQWCLWRQGGN